MKRIILVVHMFFILDVYSQKSESMSVKKLDDNFYLFSLNKFDIKKIDAFSTNNNYLKIKRKGRYIPFNRSIECKVTNEVKAKTFNSLKQIEIISIYDMLYYNKDTSGLYYFQWIIEGVDSINFEYNFVKEDPFRERLFITVNINRENNLHIGVNNAFKEDRLVNLNNATMVVLNDELKEIKKITLFNNRDTGNSKIVKRGHPTYFTINVPEILSKNGLDNIKDVQLIYYIQVGELKSKYFFYKTDKEKK